VTDNLETKDTTAPNLEPDQVEWIVNNLGELGVKIGDRKFFLYKGRSMEYTDGAIEGDGTRRMMWRAVGKREFGETCKPFNWWKIPPRTTSNFPDGIYEVNLEPGIGYEATEEELAWKELVPEAEYIKLDPGAE
jgi:hypothetical protein